jgi:hypothetical protein
MTSVAGSTAESLTRSVHSGPDLPGIGRRLICSQDGDHADDLAG